MHIDVFLTGLQNEQADVQDCTVVVVDVLRTSTTIAAALYNGASAVVPVSDMGEAGVQVSSLGASSVVLGGERGGHRIEGYRFGNSPLEYTAERIAGKTLVLNTTNGTPAICRAAAAAHLVIGGFVNVSAVADFVRGTGRDVRIVCAGWRGRISLEDTLCAGMILHRLWSGSDPHESTDAAHIALMLYHRAATDLTGAVARSGHGLRLTAMGRSEDVRFCSMIDTLPVLPAYREGRIMACRPGREVNGAPDFLDSTAKLP